MEKVMIGGEEWPIVSSYTREQAIEDGLLVYVGDVIWQSGSRVSVAFTRALFDEGGYENKEKRIALVKTAIEMLNKPDCEDTEYMRLRVVEKDKIWAIADGDGITILRPEDY
jgi:hypothetical protein